MLVRSEPMLQIPSAEDDRGRIVSWAVDKGVLGLIKMGQWPVDSRWAPFAKPTGRYLQVRLSHSVLSISQVAKGKVQPRNVGFRQNARLNNQPSFNLAEFEDTRSVVGLPSFLLVHGYQDLDFAHLGVPHPQHKRSYIYQTPNLMLMAHEVSAGVPPVEQTDIEAVMTLKEGIEKWRRDNGIE